MNREVKVLVEKLQALGRHLDVIRQLSVCLLLDPGNAATHYNLGVALPLNGGDRERVAQELKKALGLQPDYIEAKKALDALR